MFDSDTNFVLAILLVFASQTRSNPYRIQQSEYSLRSLIREVLKLVRVSR